MGYTISRQPPADSTALAKGTYNQESRSIDMEITKDTRVSEILEKYGDIADVMEVFGVKRVSGFSMRRLITKAITVEWAARVHRVPLDEFLGILRKAIATKRP